MQRWEKGLKPGIIKGRWSEDEDRALVYLVSQGHKNWGQVAAHMPGRTSKQCRERWNNYLDPTLVHTPFSDAEDKVLLSLHSQHGNKWALIARHIPGRTENAVKLRFHALTKRTTSSSESNNLEPTTSENDIILANENDEDNNNNPNNNGGNNTGSAVMGSNNNVSSSSGSILKNDSINGNDRILERDNRFISNSNSKTGTNGMAMMYDGSRVSHSNLHETGPSRGPILSPVRSASGHSSSHLPHTHSMVRSPTLMSPVSSSSSPNLSLHPSANYNAIMHNLIMQHHQQQQQQQQQVHPNSSNNMINLNSNYTGHPHFQVPSYAVNVNNNPSLSYGRSSIGEFLIRLFVFQLSGLRVSSPLSLSNEL